MENKDYKETNQDYCSPEQESKDLYNRPVYETAEEYNQAKREAGQYQQYNYQQYNYQQYQNSQYANLGGAMVDAAGNPLKSHFAVQLVFAIIEILLCCFSPVAMVLGIIALVFAVQANTAFNHGNAADFKSKSKTSTILLIVGGVFAAISIIINVVFASVYLTQLEDIISEIEHEMEYEDWEDEDWDKEDSDDEDVYSYYPGTDENYLVDGFEDFTYNGVAYSIPMSYSDFQKMGYYLEEGYEDYVLEAMTYESIWFYDEDGNELGMIRISNDTEEEIALEEGIVDYIYFDNPASYVTDENLEHIDLVFGEGFDMYTTYEELEEWLGTPYYVSIDNSGGSEYVTYEWTYYGDDKYQSIEVSYWNGVITDVAFEQYDFVY